MELYDVNKMVIEELKKLQESMMIDEIEKKIAEKKWDASYEQLIFKRHEEFNRIKKRVLLLNEHIISNCDSLKNRLQIHENIYRYPCGIEYIDNPLNWTLYLVNNFYRELFNQFQNNSIKSQLLWLSPGPYGRFINKEYLNDEQREQALRLNEFLQLYNLKQCIENLMFFVEHIQVNYLDNKN